MHGDKEHVTPYIKRNLNKFKIENYTNSTNLSNLRLTIDEQIDCEMIEQLTNLVKDKYFFGIKRC